MQLTCAGFVVGNTRDLDRSIREQTAGADPGLFSSCVRVAILAEGTAYDIRGTVGRVFVVGAGGITQADIAGALMRSTSS
jgi:hypothetical protein